MRDDPSPTPVHMEAKRARRTVVHLSYASAPEEAGPERQFDFSDASLADRWEAGVLDMPAAIGLLARPPDGGGTAGFVVHRARR